MTDRSEKQALLDKEEAESEAAEMKDIMKRRGIIGSPLHADYNEAHEKIEREKTTREEKELGEPKNIEELIDLVIFDWDGVMYDSMENIAEAAVEVVKRFGGDLTTQQFHASYDQPFWDYYRRLGLPVGTEEERAYIQKIYHDEILPKIKSSQTKNTDTYPEVADTLKELALRRIKVAIISADKLENITSILTQKGLMQYILYPIGLAHHKTEAIKELCAVYGFNPERVLMLGDLPSDLREAKKAGVNVAAVARHQIAKDRLSSYDPDYLFETIGPEIFHLTPHQDKHE